MTTMFCKRCGRQHNLVYRRLVNGTLHLLYVCEKTHESFLQPFVAGLEIPTVESEKLQKAKRAEAQQGFGF